MLKNGGGPSVNTASGAGLGGVEQLSGYNASKQVVVGLIKTAALEYAQKNIRVNCVCPGLINTPMVARMIDCGGMDEQVFIAAEPVGRMGKPEEIGEDVVLSAFRGILVRDRPLSVDRRGLCRTVSSRLAASTASQVPYLSFEFVAPNLRGAAKITLECNLLS
jgi:NAD(P)-dependent dehydrogenase (short-subunit alcohol dehydrogenase family)